MKKLAPTLLLAACFISPLMWAQSPCDTEKISACLARATELFDAGQVQAAVDSTQLAQTWLDRCPEMEAAFRLEMLQQIADAYQSTAAELMYRSQINQSIDVSERALAIYRQMPGDQSEAIASIYLDLANAYTLNDNRKLAIEKAVAGLKIRQAANPMNPKIGQHYDRIITNYLALYDNDNALMYLREWEKLHLKIGAKANASARVNLANNWALYYYNKNDLARACQVLEDSLALYGPTLRAKGAMAGGLVGICEFNLCEYYSVLGNFKKALVYAENNVTLFETRLKQQRGRLLGRSHYTWCLAQSAKAAWGLYRQTQDTAWYNFAERRSTQAENLIFAMRDRAPNDGFMDWMGDDIDIVANIAEVRQGIFAKTGNVYHAERAFEAIEASKTFTMQQFLHETYALRWAGLPDSIYQLETEYRQQINDLETNFFMIRAQPNADSLIAANDQQLFALRDRYSVFLTQLEQQYPEYFRLKYSHPAVNLREVQRHTLQPGQCALDLYIRNDLVFAMLIRPDTIVWLTTPYDSVKHQAIEYLKTESHHFAGYQNLPETEYLQRLQQYADAAFLAYQTLIEPIRPLLLGEVLLVPRNELSSLPFGALLTQRETNMAKPFQWHFLENELVLSQTFSLGLFEFVQNRPKTPETLGSVLALAPFFEGKISGDLQLPVGDVSNLTRGEIFNPLPNSGEEALAITRMTHGLALMGPEATQANFLKKCPSFKILHFATHSVANDVLGEYSFVALQTEKATQKIDMLYARDIYGLRISADLVVLSACETALGQYRYGEGIVGLSRAFTCAGARNVVASLWSVNDASTKNLMILFYREMQQGLPYNKALSNAKRAFIKENRQYAHPFYWAGFVLNGR